MRLGSCVELKSLGRTKHTERCRKIEVRYGNCFSPLALYNHGVIELYDQCLGDKDISHGCPVS